MIVFDYQIAEISGGGGSPGEGGLVEVGGGSVDEMAREFRLRYPTAVFLPPLLEMERFYAKLGTSVFPLCNTTKTMCSEFSRTEDSSAAPKSIALARV